MAYHSISYHRLACQSSIFLFLVNPLLCIGKSKSTQPSLTLHNLYSLSQRPILYSIFICIFARYRCFISCFIAFSYAIPLQFPHFFSPGSSQRNHCGLWSFIQGHFWRFFPTFSFAFFYIPCFCFASWLSIFFFAQMQREITKQNSNLHCLEKKDRILFIMAFRNVQFFNLNNGLYSCILCHFFSLILFISYFPPNNDNSHPQKKEKQSEMWLDNQDLASYENHFLENIFW